MGCYIVFELLFGLATARSSEPNDKVKALVFRSQWVTVVSWLTYPVVYVFPMLGLSGLAPWLPSSAAIALPTSSPSAVSASSSTALPRPSPRSRRSQPCCHSETESEFEKMLFGYSALSCGDGRVAPSTVVFLGACLHFSVRPSLPSMR